MEKKDDLRVIRTKLSIKKAFYELIEEKPFNKISVRDIAERAMINRATFYLHYQDKFDLMSSLEDEVLTNLKSCTDIVTKTYIDEHLKNGSPFPHLIEALKFIEDNSAFFKLIANDEIGATFYNKVGEIICNKLFNIYPELQTNALMKKYIKGIGTAVFSSIINQWVCDGMAEDKIEIASLLSTTIRSFYK